MRDIHLHGALGKEFGRKYRFAVSSVSEAIQALIANFPTFKEFVRHGLYKVVVGKSASSGMALDEEEARGFNLGNQALHIIPVAAGRKRGGLGKIIAGIALIGLAMIPGGAGAAGALWSGGGSAMAGTLGTSMLLTGVATMIAPEQRAEETNKSFTMGGPTSNTKEGNILPIVYGEVITGGYMISGGITIDSGDANPSSNAGKAAWDQVGGSLHNRFPFGNSQAPA